MMTHKKISADSKGEDLSHYLRESIKLDGDGQRIAKYYGGWDPRGTWRRGMSPDIAKALGIDISQAPTEEALARLFEARRADNGEKWTTEKRGISCVDLQVGVHKSVTMAAIGAQSEAERAAIMQAIWKANNYALELYSRRLGVTRHGRDGAAGLIYGEMAWVSFMHFTARPTHALQDGPDGKTEVKSLKLPSDPHLHIHNPTFNLLACDDGKLRALDLRQLDHLKEFGGLFQAKLADELKAMGIRCRYDANEQAVVVDAVPDEISEAFSKGRATVLARAKRFAKEQELDWDELPKRRKHALLNEAASHKIQKDDGVGDEERWQAEIKALGWEHTTSLTGEYPQPLTEKEWLDQTYAFTARHLAEEFETSACLNLEVLRRIAAWSLIGAGTRGDQSVNKVVEAVMERGIEFDGKHSELIIGQSRGKIRLTHTVQVELERSVQSLAISMGEDRSHSLTRAETEQAIQRSGAKFEGDIGPQQRRAVEAMLEGPSLVFLEGLAGSTKTTAVLPTCVQEWQRRGYRIIGICQAWRQTDDLSQAGITERVAITPFIEGVRNGSIKVDGKTIIVLDEAAQVSPRQFLEMQRLWLQHGTMLKAMGDRLQCQGIEAASAAEIIARDDILPDDALPKIEFTVRQRTKEEREIATAFRKTKAEDAITQKRAKGTAKLVGGDYDQVVSRIADRYLALRAMAERQEWTKGVAMFTLTNQDAAEISKKVRERLQARGEVSTDEKLYQAIDNRGVKYDLPIAIGDRQRLFKKTFGFVDGKFKDIGSNGDVVEILGEWEQGLRIRTKSGEDAKVRWKSLKDPVTGRLKLGYGHCLTIDAAQGLTASVTIHALPRGSTNETAFKAYVAESRHVEFCETLISEAAMYQAVKHSRPFGDRQEITEDDMWKRVAKDMSARPTKSLALDLLDKVLERQDALINDMLRLDQRLQLAAIAKRNFSEEARHQAEGIEIRSGADQWLPKVEQAIYAKSEVISSLRDHMADTLRDLEEYLKHDPGPDLSWYARPGVSPSL